MKKLALVTAAVSALVLTGCMDQRTYLDGYDEEGVEVAELEGWTDSGNLLIESSQLRGDIGGVRDIDDDARVRNGYGDDGYASVEMHAENRSGAAMSLVEIWGGLDELAPGLSTTYRADEAEYDADRLNVQVIGCSGPGIYEWDYDAPADEVDVTVEETDDPEVLRLEYTARTYQNDPFTGLPNGQADVVTGVIDYRK